MLVITAVIRHASLLGSEWWHEPFVGFVSDSAHRVALLQKLVAVAGECNAVRSVEVKVRFTIRVLFTKI